jgi:hypothetical protein
MTQDFIRPLFTVQIPGSTILEREDVRKAWPNEAAYFTPWLAQAASLTDLGKIIGIELELVATEQNVGPFRADILCKDTLTGRYVLIENQLEWTDHSHLGQLLTRRSLDLQCKSKKPVKSLSGQNPWLVWASRALLAA